jgi:hypothetical protein
LIGQEKTTKKGDDNNQQHQGHKIDRTKDLIQEARSPLRILSFWLSFFSGIL